MANTANMDLAQASSATKKPRYEGVSRKQGLATPAGVNQGQLVRQNNRWRENYNPLRGLVLQRLVALFEAGERGEFADLEWLYRMIEKRFPVLRSLILRRRSAITKLDWEVKIVEELPGRKKNAKGDYENDPAMTALAERQREFLKGRYELIGNLKEAIKFLALAEFRGFSILNKHRYAGGPNDGAVRELHWLPQWNFARDGLFGEWYWNAEAASGATAMSLGEQNVITEGGESPDFIIRTVEMPINEIAAIAMVRSNLSQKDWDAFIEIFGLTGCVVIMPANIPEGKETEYRSAAEKIAEGASGALPNGGDAKFPAAGARASAPFKEHLEWQEKDVVLAGTGGKLTMLTGPVGLGGGQAEVHEDVFDEIATAEAGEISEVFQCQFDRPELAAEFPGEPVLAYFALQPVDQTAEETKKFQREVYKAFLMDGTVNDVLANLADLKQLTEVAGVPKNPEAEDPWLPVQTATGELVTGETLTDPEGDVIGAKPEQTAPSETPNSKLQTPGKLQAPSLNGKPVVNRGGAKANAPSETLMENGQELYAQALASDLQHMRERVAALDQISDDQVLRHRAMELLGDLETIRHDVTQAPKAAQAMMMTQVAALFTGLTQPIKNRSQKIFNGDAPGHEFHGNQWTEAVAAEHRRLRGEADAAHVATHNAEYGSVANANDEELAALHQDAATKYKAARDHAAQSSGTRGTVRLMGQKARDHKEYAAFYSERAKGKK